MRKSFLFSVLLLSACEEKPAAPPPPPAPVQAPQPAVKKAEPAYKRYDAKVFFENTEILLANFSHDGTRVLFSGDKSGVFNVYAQPVAGGEATRLTTSTETQHAIGFFPGDDRFLYSQDQGGNEAAHIFVGEAGKEPRDLTPGDKLKAAFVDWSHDDQAFYVMTNERDSKSFDVYRYAIKDYARQLMFRNDQSWSIGAVSGDGRYIALRKTRTNADSDIYLYDTKTKAKPRLITAHKGDANYDVSTFTPDGKKLWYQTDGQGEFRQAWSYDLMTNQAQSEVATNWDVLFTDFSKNGRYRVTATNEDARVIMRITDVNNNREVSCAHCPQGVISRAFFSRDEKRMAFSLLTERSPDDLYVLDLESGDAKQLTHDLNPEMNPADLVDAQVIRYPSFDKLPIPAILYRPKDATATHKVPALVKVHGGPGGQSQIGYNPDVQHLVNHGYAVLAVNNRGSSGYGKTFFHLDDKHHGDVDLKDCVEARKYLESLDWVDAHHIGIWGGSYGGYMVGAALAFTPDAFDVGIDLFGVMNWVRTLSSIPPWWTSFREALYSELGDPAKDGERLRAISPLYHAANIKKPLLVVQGKNDVRVLKAESEEIVAAVKKNNVPVELIVFDDEGHGFTKRNNQITAAAASLKFLDTYLHAK